MKTVRKPSVQIRRGPQEWDRQEFETTVEAHAEYVRLRAFHRAADLHLDYGQVAVELPEELGSEQTFPQGTPTRCNRCDQVSPFPKTEGHAVRENSRAWRLQTMATLACGHMDAHWVYDSDLSAAGAGCAQDGRLEESGTADDADDSPKVGRTTRRIEYNLFDLLVDDERRLYIPQIKRHVMEARRPLPLGLYDAARELAPEGYEWADRWAD